MEIDEIEHKIACGEMSAAQAFTQMKQHIIDRNKVLDEAVEAIENCEVIEPSKGVYRIRLYEAIGAVVSLKKRTGRHEDSTP